MEIILFILGITLMYSSPLIFTALGGMLSERSAVVNIGVDGLMTLGAFIGATISYFTGNVWIAFISAGLICMGVSVLHGIGTVTCKANHTVIGVAMNFFAPGVALVACDLIFDGASSTPSCPSFPGILDGIVSPDSPLYYLNIKIPVLIAIAAAILVHIMLYKTKLGLHIRAVGEHPDAADAVGINVNKIKYICVLLSGLFAGLGGATMTLSVVSQFSFLVVIGNGFIALGAVMLGKWTPLGSLWSCLLFGFMQSLVVLLGGTGLSNYTMLLSALPFVVMLTALVIVGNSEDPKTNGLPYVRSYR